MRLTVMIEQHVELPSAFKKVQCLRTLFNVNLYARHALLYTQLTFIWLLDLIFLAKFQIA